MKERLRELLYCAERDYDDYTEECHESGMSPMESFDEYAADYLIAKGVVIVDPEKYPPITNRGIIDTIMGVPLDEMAELIRAKQEGRLVVSPAITDNHKNITDTKSYK